MVAPAAKKEEIHIFLGCNSIFCYICTPELKEGLAAKATSFQ